MYYGRRKLINQGEVAIIQPVYLPSHVRPTESGGIILPTLDSTELPYPIDKRCCYMAYVSPW
jgi:hypothetical protein